MMGHVDVAEQPIAFVRRHQSAPLGAITSSYQSFYSCETSCQMGITMIVTMERPFSVVETENVCGGSPRIRGSRIPLWGLEKARLNGFTDEEIIEMYPHLEIADLEDAWEYIAANKEEIEKALIENS